MRIKTVVDHDPVVLSESCELKVTLDVSALGRGQSSTLDECARILCGILESIEAWSCLLAWLYQFIELWLLTWLHLEGRKLLVGSVLESLLLEHFVFHLLRSRHSLSRFVCSESKRCLTINHLRSCSFSQFTLCNRLNRTMPDR